MLGPCDHRARTLWGTVSGLVGSPVKPHAAHRSASMAQCYSRVIFASGRSFPSRHFSLVVPPRGRVSGLLAPQPPFMDSEVNNFRETTTLRQGRVHESF
jgi:hypothetical protein